MVGQLSASSGMPSPSKSGGGGSGGQDAMRGLLGLLLVAIGYAFATWALAVNRFFSGVVRIQKDRGHVVCDRGPYRIVRHPGYAGNLLALPGLVLALGSSSINLSRNSATSSLSAAGTSPISPFAPRRALSVTKSTTPSKSA
jgi:hypothetical protein